jgi:hypothetical protein
VELETTAHPAFRAPENVYHDLVETCRFSPAPILIKNDIRIPGDHFGERLLSLLQHKPVANPLIFELDSPASAFFIQEVARAAPGFRLNIAPCSHDEAVRKRMGQTYSNKELESTIEAAMRARADRVEVMFLTGLPGQTAESVTDTVAYCEYLLRRFDGDRRLSLSIAPFGQSRGFTLGADSERCGFKPRFDSFEEFLKALALPSWQDRLEYETAVMSAAHLAETIYNAWTRLAQLKAKYGQIPYKHAEDLAKNYATGMEMTKHLEEIVRNGHADELAFLEPEIDRINDQDANPRPHAFPLILSRPQNLLVLFKSLSKHKTSNVAEINSNA